VEIILYIICVMQTYMSYCRQSCTILVDAIIYVDAGSKWCFTWSKVKDTEEFIGVLSLTLSLPQYLITATDNTTIQQ
jgi:hypothetical protein